LSGPRTPGRRHPPTRRPCAREESRPEAFRCGGPRACPV